jgi:hypothetical protein
MGIIGVSRRDHATIAGYGLLVGVADIVLVYLMEFGYSTHMGEPNIFLAVVGYGFALANASIGIANFRDLNAFKQQLGYIKAHKAYGRVETISFYAISTVCLAFPTVSWLKSNPSALIAFGVYPTLAWHFIIGGIIPFFLFMVKLVPAFHYKDTIYKYGRVLGPIGFTAWSLAYWTAIIDFYTWVVPPTTGYYHSYPGVIPWVWPSIAWAVFTSIAIGVILFLYARSYNYKIGKPTLSPATHGVALILHGISFGYENAAKELVGSPVLFKYVYPYTYKSIDKLSALLGIRVDDLRDMAVSDAVEAFMARCAKIGMAEEIQVKWKSATSFTVESINCSTSVVRSRIPPDEIKGSICPWALLSASLVNKLTGKELEITPSEFNEIGAKTVIRIKETPK